MRIRVRLLLLLLGVAGVRWRRREKGVAGRTRTRVLRRVMRKHGGRGAVVRVVGAEVTRLRREIEPGRWVRVRPPIPPELVVYPEAVSGRGHGRGPGYERLQCRLLLQVRQRRRAWTGGGVPVTGVYIGLVLEVPGRGGAGCPGERGERRSDVAAGRHRVRDRPGSSLGGAVRVAALAGFPRALPCAGGPGCGRGGRGRRDEAVAGFRLALDAFGDAVDAVVVGLRPGDGIAVRVESAAGAQVAVLALEEQDAGLEVMQERGSPRPECALDVARALRPPSERTPRVSAPLAALSGHGTRLTEGGSESSCFLPLFLDSADADADADECCAPGSGEQLREGPACGILSGTLSLARSHTTPSRLNQSGERVPARRATEFKLPPECMSHRFRMLRASPVGSRLAPLRLRAAARGSKT